MKILFIKNQINYDISDDVNKFKDWLKRKTPLSFEFEEMILNLKVKLINNAGGLNKIGIGLIEASKMMSFLPEKYQVVIFLYNITSDGTYVAKTYPLFNRKTIFIEVPANSYLETKDELYRLLTHEVLHAFHAILRMKGITTEDTMDFYDGEYDIENGHNRMRNLIMIGPYWKKLDPSPLDTVITAITGKKYKYFKPSEIKGLKDELVTKLDAARELAGVPFVITSGLRTLETNEEVGGVPNSSHLNGLGCDIGAFEGSRRYRILLGLLNAGFKRIGVYPKHIHCDIDSTKPQEVCWVG